MTYPQPEDESTSSGPSQPKDAMASPQREDGSTSLGPSQPGETMAFPQPEDGPTSLGSSQHSDGLASSGYPSPYLSEGSSVSGYSWLLNRPPRLSPNRPSSSHDSDSTSVHPNSGEMTLEEWRQLSLDNDWWQLPPVPPSPPAPLQELAPLPHGPHPSSLGTSEILHPPPQLTVLDPATTEPEGLALSPHVAAGGWPPAPSSPPTETPPDNAEFFNKEMVKGVKILAGTIIVGGIIGGIVGFEIKHQKSKDG